MKINGLLKGKVFLIQCWFKIPPHWSWSRVTIFVCLQIALLLISVCTDKRSFSSRELLGHHYIDTGYWIQWILNSEIIFYYSFHTFASCVAAMKKKVTLPPWHLIQCQYHTYDCQFVSGIYFKDINEWEYEKRRVIDLKRRYWGHPKKSDKSNM